jgi:hypothetical protein
MAIKTINLTLDKDEFAFAISKKGSRTWKEVLFDGLEWKRHGIEHSKTKLGGYLQSHPEGPKTKTK